MERIVTILGTILAVLFIVLVLAGLTSTFVSLMLPIAVVLIGIGVLIGR